MQSDISLAINHTIHDHDLVGLLQVLGDRELLDDESVGELAVTSPSAANSSSYLHIVCKLKDIESVTINTSMQRTLSFAFDDSSQPIRRSKSALTAMLASSDRCVRESCCRLGDVLSWTTHAMKFRCAIPICKEN